ncbi:ECF transporter S component [Clostridioides difficile]
MKKNNTSKLVLISLCVGINVIGALIAVALKLPIFLDTIGTFTVAFLFGPIAGMITGVLSYSITTVTFDPYALYFIPSQIVVGLLAGILYKKGGFKKKVMIPFTTLLIASCSAFVAAIASAFVFGGITSSGNSIIVMYLSNLGLGLVPSVFITQILTEFIDKIIIVLLVFNVIKVMPKNFKAQVNC